MKKINNCKAHDNNISSKILEYCTLEINQINQIKSQMPRRYRYISSSDSDDDFNNCTYPRGGCDDCFQCDDCLAYWGTRFIDYHTDGINYRMDGIAGWDKYYFPVYPYIEEVAVVDIFSDHFLVHLTVEEDEVVVVDIFSDHFLVHLTVEEDEVVVVDIFSDHFLAHLSSEEDEDVVVDIFSDNFHQYLEELFCGSVFL